MKTKEMNKKTNWINLLLSNGGSIEEFESIRATSKTDLFALCRYKKTLRSRGNGEVELRDIETSYNQNDINKLHKLLNELFLEYHTENEIMNLLNLMKKTGTSIKQVYDRHLEFPENTLLSHLSL